MADGNDCKCTYFQKKGCKKRTFRTPEWERYVYLHPLKKRMGEKKRTFCTHVGCKKTVTNDSRHFLRERFEDFTRILSRYSSLYDAKCFFMFVRIAHEKTYHQLAAQPALCLNTLQKNKKGMSGKPQAEALLAYVTQCKFPLPSEMYLPGLGKIHSLVHQIQKIFRTWPLVSGERGHKCPLHP